MKNFILQTNNSDCGLACIKMLLAYYHKDQSYLYIDNKKKGTYSLLDLKLIGEENGLITKGVQIDIEHLKGMKNIIVQTKEDSKSHFMVLKKIKNNKVYLFDPSNEKVKMLLEDFKEIFTGYALIIDKVEERKLNKKTNILSFWYFLSYVISILIDVGFIYLISYTFKIEDDYLISTLSVIGIVINFIFKMIISVLASRAFEKKYLLKNIDKMNEEEIKELLNFKKNYLHYYFSMINYISIFIFGSIILIINGLYTLFFIGFTVACLALRYTLIEKVLSKQMKNAEREERVMFNSARKEKMYHKCQINAENYTFYYMLVPCLYIVVIALSLSLTNKLFSYYSMNYYFFYIGFFITLYECGNEIMKNIFKNHEKLKAGKIKVLNF
jgi:predicted double-glycine peptidase